MLRSASGRRFNTGVMNRSTNLLSCLTRKSSQK